jgi:hypothetical protein
MNGDENDYWGEGGSGNNDMGDFRNIRKGTLTHYHKIESPIHSIMNSRVTRRKESLFLDRHSTASN